MEEDKNRRNFFNTIDKIESDFEKKITQISAGALALSISFIDKIVNLNNAQYFWLLIIGWFLLVLTLSINLISILVSRKLNMKSVNDYDKVLENKITENELKKIIKRRNSIITKLDFVQLGTLLLGIVFVVLFSSVNINNNKKECNMAKKEKIEEGRIIQTPQTSPKTGNGNNNQSNNSGSSSNGNKTKANRNN